MDETILPLFFLPSHEGGVFPVVGSVLEGSDAESQGVEEGDLVVSVRDGRQDVSLAGFSVQETEQHLLLSPQPVVELGMRRRVGGGSYGVKVKKVRTSEVLSHTSSKTLLNHLIRAFHRYPMSSPPSLPPSSFLRTLPPSPLLHAALPFFCPTSLPPAPPSLALSLDSSPCPILLL
eukprot:227828-Hanusia_phi.AAC.5